MNTSIYKITSPSGAIYIGKTISVERRLKEYIRLTNPTIKKQRKLYHSFLKYGFYAHKFEVIEECDSLVASARERFHIAENNSFSNGMNLTPGGEMGGIKGRKLSVSQKKFISTNNTKYTNLYCYDKDGTFVKIFSSAKIAASELKLCYKNLLRNLAGKNSHCGTYRFFDSPQTSVGLLIPPEDGKKLVQLDLSGNLIAIHKNARTAIIGTDMISTSLTRCAREKTNTAHGYRWMYAEKYENTHANT